ncbi:hypothetical protein SCHPADRAFT_946908 [Schizopora paradoxa]|uniref:MYND-type domain-containing protein n=1 Tax=Schizopora paradoxa TaxID=27342 RepID=A0A0H2R101_9AGAM|nr:hypothetical protein SCHPADRAFT_946908 [Schizopora paradoxa]
MDVTRDEIIEILGDMDVKLPANTKLPLDALQQRLTRAIELAQAPVTSDEVDPSKLKKWSIKASKKKPMIDVMGAVTWKEAAMLMAPVGQRNPMEYINAFISLRNAVVEIGVNWDEGSKLAVVEDEKMAYGFSMRIVDVYALTDDIPVFIVVYEHGSGSLFSRRAGIHFLSEPVPGMKPGQDGVEIKTTFLAQKLLLKVLEMNAKYLPESYAPALRPNEKKHGHKISFLLPIVPLTMREIGSLSKDVGCFICGNETASRCAGCQTVSYCGKVCQKADWARHKVECKNRSLENGTWLEIPLSGMGYNGMFVQSINKFSTVQGFGNDKLKADATSKLRSDADGPPENVHGDALFIIKIQVPPPGGMRAPIMIYDRQRSIEIYHRFDADRSGYEALEETARRTGYLGQKIYRYAKRTGVKKLSICLDREPSAEATKW